jgi:hypothetical protein
MLCPEGVICKPMLMGNRYVGGEHFVAYTRPVAPSEFSSLKTPFPCAQLICRRPLPRTTSCA